ncbi:Alpha/Beta hydrolase protein [Aspergillus recurvatus]
MSSNLIILPRPGQVVNGQAIPGPSEVAFVRAFGQVLPPASYLPTRNGRVAYYKHSPAANEPTASVRRVLLIHGVQTPAIGLQPLAEDLSMRFPSAQCVLVDLWGHGLTDTPFAPHEPALFHQLIEDLMEHLGWPDAHMIGYSFGGSTTVTFAAARPGRVSSMVLVAPAGLLREDRFTDEQKGYLRGGDGLEEAAKDWIFEFLEGGQLAVPSDWRERVARGEVVAEAVRDWELRNHPGHQASVVGVFRDGGVLDRHAEFLRAGKDGIPALCVLGETDDVCSAQDLYDVGLENVAVVPQVGHGVVRERVPDVAHHVEAFWRGLVKSEL